MDLTTSLAEERLVAVELVLGTMETLVSRLLGYCLDKSNAVNDILRIKEDITESVLDAICYRLN